MQKCLRCGKEIKFIATSDKNCVICDAAPILIYLATGRSVDGWTKHICQEQSGGNNGQKTEKSETGN